MKAGIVFIILIIALLFTTCEKNYYYDMDPRFFNDAMHGNIVGKILQIKSHAVITASQVDPVDSTIIDPSDGSFAIRNLPIGNYDLTIKANNYRIYKRCNVMIEGGGTTYIGEVDLSTIPDLVASHYPEDKGEIVYNNRFSRLTISMTFTQPMDRESVEKAFSTEPPTEGIFYWGYYSTSPNWIYYEDALGYRGLDAGATITTYSKITSFSYQVSQKDSYTDTTYNVILSASAKDTAGNYLRFPLKFSFSTIQSSSTLNGIQTNPYHGDMDVTLISSSGIRITFPRNMNQISTEEAITVIPESDIIFIWPQKNSLTIYTGGVFRAETKYTVTVDSLARDLDGSKLGNTFSFYFTTASVAVSYTSPVNGELFVSTGTDIYVTFNTYMIKSSVQNALTISPVIPGTLDWSNNSKTVMEFSPSQSLKYNIKYTITIGTVAMDIFGTHLKEPYSFSFITRPE
jgi:hypothetical protein